jgi:hypothetical protein
VSGVAHIRLLSAPVEVGGGFDGLAPISPELALIDPELARAARALLPDQMSLEALRPAVRELAVCVAATDEGDHEAGALPTVRTAPPVAREGAFVLRHFVVGIGVGLLLAGLAVEAYVLTAPLRSGPSAQGVASTPGLTDPAPTGQPTVTVPTPSQHSDNEDTGRAATATGTGVATAVVLAWPAKPGAVAYRVTLLQRGRPILERRTRVARLTLPVRWRYEGRRHQLVPGGTYRWLVRPLRRVGSTLRPGEPVVDAVYVLSPR